jgi:undecaprenyl-diphosphatase
MKSPLSRLFLAFIAAALLLVACVVWVDAPLTRAVIVSDPAARAFWEPITRAGLSGWYFAGLPILFILFRFAFHRRIAANRCVFMFLTLMWTGLIGLGLKLLVGRARPRLMQQGQYGFDPFRMGQDNYSLPSGHAGTVAALAACLWVLFPRWRWLWAALAAVIASSRIAVGSHFLSDVLAGALLAVIMMIATLRTLERWGVPLGRDQAGVLERSRKLNPAVDDPAPRL